jgi:hypothetical protein
MLAASNFRNEFMSARGFHHPQQQSNRFARLSIVVAAAAVCVAVFASLAAAAAMEAGAEVDSTLPRTLRETGLYATGSTTETRAGVVAFSPQYPLWSDGAEKRRWLALPPGAFIDASRPDAWEFPRGTKLWKEFAHEGRPVETRYIERRRDGSWRFATYLWNEAGDEAVLAPAEGNPALPVRGAPGGRYAVPSREDCLACHGSTPVPVLGVSALQLSPERDPLAPGARPRRAGEVDLRGLIDRGWLRRLPGALLERPPVIAAATPVERAALGYLHANCGHCHNRSEFRAPVRLTLAQRAADPEAARQEVLRSALDAPSRYRPPGSGNHALVISPGSPEHSVLAMRMRSRDPRAQMPPLGTHVPDHEGLALIQRWIANDLSHRKETAP